MSGGKAGRIALGALIGALIGLAWLEHWWPVLALAAVAYIALTVWNVKAARRG